MRTDSGDRPRLRVALRCIEFILALIIGTTLLGLLVKVFRVEMGVIMAVIITAWVRIRRTAGPPHSSSAPRC